MTSIGYLNHERLGFIPPKYWAAHEFCFYIHDTMLRALVEYGSSGIHELASEAFEELVKSGHVEPDIDFLSFMKDNAILGPYKHHLISHLVLSLSGDMLNFLYESFSCFEKRKFAVAFSLLRKPIKENLTFLCWILGVEDEFIEKFEYETYKSLNHTSKDKQIKIFKSAIEKLPVPEMFDENLLWDLIFSKESPGGFEQRWQKATHLITSQGNLLKTEKYSINFVFEDPRENENYKFIYKNLAYVMIFVSQVLFECFNRILTMNKATYSHMVVTSMGCYEPLFSGGKNQGMIKMLNKEISEFLVCIHCNSKITINRKNAPAMYIRDALECNHCGLQSAFPFYWLVSKLSIVKEPSEATILSEMEKGNT